MVYVYLLVYHLYLSVHYMVYLNNNQKKIEVIISFQCTKTMIIYSESEEKAHREAYRKLMDSVDTFSDTEFESTLPVEINSKNFHSIQNI